MNAHEVIEGLERLDEAGFTCRPEYTDDGLWHIQVFYGQTMQHFTGQYVLEHSFIAKTRADVSAFILTH